MLVDIERVLAAAAEASRSRRQTGRTDGRCDYAMAACSVIIPVRRRQCSCCCVWWCAMHLGGGWSGNERATSARCSGNDPRRSTGLARRAHVGNYSYVNTSASTAWPTGRWFQLNTATDRTDSRAETQTSTAASPIIVFVRNTSLLSLITNHCTAEQWSGFGLSSVCVCVCVSGQLERNDLSPRRVTWCFTLTRSRSEVKFTAPDEKRSFSGVSDVSWLKNESEVEKASYCALWEMQTVTTLCRFQCAVAYSRSCHNDIYIFIHQYTW